MKAKQTFKSAANETKDIFRKSVGTMNGLIGMYGASDGDMFIPSEETLRSVISDYMKIMRSLPDLMDTTIDAYVEQYEDVVWLKNNFEEFRRVQSNRYEDLCKRCDSIERKIDKLIETANKKEK